MNNNVYIFCLSVSLGVCVCVRVLLFFSVGFVKEKNIWS